MLYSLKNITMIDSYYSKLLRIYSMDFFYINRKVKALVLVVVVLLAIVFFVTNNNSEYLLYSQIALILFTIILSTFLSAWFIESREYNNIVDKFLFDGILSSSECLKKVPESLRRKASCSLNKNLYFSDSEVKEGIFERILSKIDDDSKYYYQECKVDVECKIYNDKIIKNISKHIEISAYSNNIDEDNYQFLTVDFDDKTENEITIESIQVNGKDEKYYTKDCQCNEKLKMRNGYIKTRTFYLSNKITIPAYKSSQKVLSLDIKYKTTFSILDPVYVCRLNCPCKQFSLSFSLVDQIDNEYKLQSFAFGFINQGTENGLNSEKAVKICFTDWIYKYDGVVIFISK